MGNQQASFSAEQIEQYQDCTFFTKKEIIKLHQRFRELNPDVNSLKIFYSESKVTITRSCKIIEI